MTVIILDHISPSQQYPQESTHTNTDPCILFNKVLFRSLTHLKACTRLRSANSWSSTNAWRTLILNSSLEERRDTHVMFLTVYTLKTKQTKKKLTLDWQNSFDAPQWQIHVLGSRWKVKSCSSVTATVSDREQVSAEPVSVKSLLFWQSDPHWFHIKKQY